MRNQKKYDTGILGSFSNVCDTFIYEPEDIMIRNTWDIDQLLEDYCGDELKKSTLLSNLAYLGW
jgi:hypothetical protein